jgi:subtilisin family serine protease
MVEADAAHATTTGTGAVVAVIDSGVLPTHEDLKGRLLDGRDFVQDDNVPQDGDGHGTHVTGVVVATKDNGLGVSSVAPGATVLPIRVLDDEGSGETADVARAIDYAVARGAHVINLSLGSDVPLLGAGGDRDLNAALDRAADAGVVIVAAAGNNTVPICEQPSVGDRLLCVGSVDRRRTASFFSSFAGPRGVVAPGGSGLVGPDEDILSTWNDGKYDYAAGTSQATPHAAGVAALLVSLGMRGSAVADRILATASDAGPPGPDDQYGAGIVNARAAVEGLRPPGGGGGGTGGGSGGGSTSSGSVSVAKHHRTAKVLKNGIRVRCKPPASGRCSARVVSGSTTVAYGSAKAKAGRAVTIVARTTKAGRKLLNRKRKVSAKAEISLPGAPARVKSLSIKR